MPGADCSPPTAPSTKRQPPSPSCDRCGLGSMTNALLRQFSPCPPTVASQWDWRTCAPGCDRSTAKSQGIWMTSSWSRRRVAFGSAQPLDSPLRALVADVGAKGDPLQSQILKRVCRQQQLRFSVAPGPPRGAAQPGRTDFDMAAVGIEVPEEEEAKISSLSATASRPAACSIRNGSITMRSPRNSTAAIGRMKRSCQEHHEQPARASDATKACRRDRKPAPEFLLPRAGECPRDPAPPCA